MKFTWIEIVRRSVPTPLQRLWRGDVALLLPAILALALAASSEAQTTPAPATYKIGAGDLLRIDVSGRPDLSGQFTVGFDGSVLLPVLGSIKAVDRTAGELAADLSRRASLVQREIPKVTVSVMEYRSRKVFVLGEVLLPGAYSFGVDPTVWDAIAEAGGPTEAANMAAVEVIPSEATPGRSLTVVDVAAAIKGGTLDALQKLRPGDTVRVQRFGASTGEAGSTSNQFYIFGAVGAQGAHPMPEVPDLVTAIIRSVPTPDADFSKVQIVRKSGPRLMQMTVDVRDYLGKAETNGNPPVQPGDTVYVPRLSRGPGLLGAIGWISTVVGVVTSIAFLSR